jgi:hypothetical protein
MPPFLDRRRDTRSGLQYSEVHAALGEVRGCRKTDRPRSDNDDRRPCLLAHDPNSLSRRSSKQQQLAA